MKPEVGWGWGAGEGGWQRFQRIRMAWKGGAGGALQPGSGGEQGAWVWQCSGRRAQEAGLELRDGPVLPRSTEELECWGSRRLVPPRQGQGRWRPV